MGRENVLEVSVVLEAGTYRLAATFAEYYRTPISYRTVPPELSGIAGVYYSSTTLRYPSTVDSTYLYGHVNFRFVPLQ